MLLERPGQKPLREKTTIPHAAHSAAIRKQNRQTADDLYTLRMGELARQDVGLPTLGPKRTLAFNKYADWFAVHYLKKRKQADRDTYALAALRSFFGSDDLTQIDSARVAEYESDRLNNGKAASTVNREVDLLKGMLRDAVPKYLKVSPLAGRKKLRTVKPPKRIVGADEEAKLLAAFRNPADRAFYLIAVDTLMRLSNVIDLKWSEVKGGFVALTDSKTGAYTVALSDRARAALQALPRAGVYVFPHRRGAKNARDNRGTARRLLMRACKRAGIPYGRGHGVTFHTATRATGATRMLRKGIDPRTVQAIGNWKDFRAMQEYLQPDTAQMTAAVNTIAGEPNHATVTDKAKQRKRSTKTGRK